MKVGTIRFWQLLLWVGWGVCPAWAQQRDSLQIGFEHETVQAEQRVLPASARTQEAARLLEPFRQGYLWDLASDSWAHGWSYAGLLPDATGLSMNGMGFNSLISGRPLWDLLPVVWLDPLHWGSAEGRSAGVATAFRAFDEKPTYTELRYDRSGSGFQSGAATHTQMRRVHWFGRPAKARVTFGVRSDQADNYFGYSASGGSAALFRIRYDVGKAILDVTESFNRRNTVTHGGIRPNPSSYFDSVYNPDIQSFADGNWRRNTRRNDFSVTYRKPVLKHAQPFQSKAYWQYERWEVVRNSKDTLRVRAHRVGLQAKQAWARASEIRADVWLDVMPEEQAVHRVHSVFPTAGLTWVNQRTWQGWLLDASLGLWAQREQAWSSGSLGIQRKSWFWQSGWGAAGQTWMTRYGMDSLATTLSGKTALGGWSETGWHGTFAQHQVDVSVFAGHNGGNGLDVNATAYQSYGAALNWRWRATAEHGLWSESRLHFVQTTADTRLFPALSGTARLGVKFRAFENDLDANMYLQIRANTAYDGLSFLHRSGLWSMAKPVYSIPNTWMADVWATAKLRTVTLHAGLENLTSGWGWMAGVYCVSLYPLQPLTFRMSVFWPMD